MKNTNQIEIYQSSDGQTQVELSLQDNTLWMTQAQIARLFEVKPQNITMHLKNIFREKELDEKSTCKDSLQVQLEGKRKVKRKLKFYHLDVIISVGYRINSSKATQFRIWATQRLKEILTQGYSLNQQRFEQNSKALQQALKLIEKTAKSPELTLEAGRGLTEIITRYTQTFLWLQRYDEGLLDEPRGESDGKLITSKSAMQLLSELKDSLIKRGEAIINDTGLAALTLLVAESDPKQKETLIRLIMHMLGACPRIDNLLQKSWICAISRFFSANSGAILLKKSKNSPKSNFPSLRFLFLDKLLGNQS